MHGAPGAFNPWSELDQMRQRDAANNGVSIDDLARTSCDVMHRVMNRPTLAWNSMPELDQIPWKEAAGKALALIDLPESERADFTLSAKALAQGLYNVFTASRCLPPDWGQVHMAERIAWEAIGRHAANIIDSEKGSVNVPDLEERIVEWAKARLTHVL